MRKSKDKKFKVLKKKDRKKERKKKKRKEKEKRKKERKRERRNGGNCGFRTPTYFLKQHPTKILNRLARVP
jgi:hypothetical protein